MRSLSRVLLLAVVCGALLYCSDGGDGAAESNLTVTSYNVGLATNFVPYTEERLAANERLLADYDGDVICFQEVWQEEQVAAIVRSIRGELPHVYTVPPEQRYSAQAACMPEEVAGLADCTRELCPGMSGSAAVSCVTAQCGALFGDLSATCLDGVIASVGIPDITIDELVETVTRPTGRFSYGGSLGLILASRYPLANREFQDLIEDSSASHRGALYADIDIGSHSLLVGCTHVTANLAADVDYPPSGKYGSWEGENRYQQRELIRFANRKAAGRPILFAGDFNCGLANPARGVSAAWPDNCQAWLDDGFADPVGEDLPCTYCYDENRVLLLGEGSSNRTIDHVYVKNLDYNATLRARRVFDDPVAIEATSPPSELPPENSPILMHPSDHFGVELEVTLRRSRVPGR